MNPVLARSDAEGRRFYTFGDPPEQFWSVTTILAAGVPKIHLQAHYAKMAAELAYDAIIERGPYSRGHAIARRLANLGRRHVLEVKAAGGLTSIKLEKLTERDLALRWIKGAADRDRDAKASRGSAVHEEAEDLVLAQARESARLILNHESIKPWPGVTAPYQRAFTDWLDDFQPEFLAAEATVISRSQAYAGTLDHITRITVDERLAFVLGLPVGTILRIVGDTKTSRAVYAEVALQLAPYARAEFIASPDGVTELPMPAVDMGAVLHLTPRGYQFRLVDIGDHVFDVFKYVREVYRWTTETSKTVLLHDLTVPRKADAA